jgi:excinuclease ABC subunit C
MQQVVFRRYRSLLAQGSSLPELVVIDGGKGQVRAAALAFEALGTPPPPLIGLAKKQELILSLSHAQPLELPRHSPALRLLQRIRDEAHRFANQFNQELRRQRLAESVLDACPGLGPAKKQALLQHFGNIHGVQKATPQALQQVKGISQQLALRVHETLHGATDAPVPLQPESIP